MRRRRVLLLLTGAGVLMSGLVSIAFLGGYRLNLTTSEPLGLWRIDALHRPVAIGDLVFICPPETSAIEQARVRGICGVGSAMTGLRR